MLQKIVVNPSATPQTIEVTIPDELAYKVSGNTPIPEPEPNLPPEVFSGNDAEVSVNSVTLIGSAKDPDGTINSVKWIQTRGTGAVIETPTLQTTKVSNLAEGVNEFTLEVSDNGGLKRSDAVLVTYKPPVPPPTTQEIYGFGSQAKGGGGKTAFAVNATNFKSSIASNRILRFTGDAVISGGIALRNISYLTIDANGYNVVIQGATGDGFSIASGSHHIIVKGIASIGSGNDTFNVIEGANNLAFLDCFAYNAKDGGFDVADGYNVTIQNCIIANCQGNGGSLCTGRLTSYYGNLFIGNNERNCFAHCKYSPVGAPNIDFRNNVVYKWGSNNGTGHGYGTAVAWKAVGNVVNNYYWRENTDSEWGVKEAVMNTDYKQAGSGGSVYAAGNISGNTGVNANSASNRAEVLIPDWAKLPMEDTMTAAKKVIAKTWANPTAQSLVKSVILK